jgi:integrase
MIKENYRLTLAVRLGRMRPAVDEEVRQILATCDARTDLHSVRDVVRIVANLGLHNSELAALRVTDIDFEGGWVFVGRARSARHAFRELPVRSKTKTALMSMRADNFGSALVLGSNPRRKIHRVIQTLKSISPGISRGRLMTHSIRLNFVSRLMSSGVPLSIVKYCLGYHDQSALLGHLSLTPGIKREILRRNLENFLLEF